MAAALTVGAGNFAGEAVVRCGTARVDDVVGGTTVLDVTGAVDSRGAGREVEVSARLLGVAIDVVTGLVAVEFTDRPDEPLQAQRSAIPNASRSPPFPSRLTPHIMPVHDAGSGSMHGY